MAKNIDFKGLLNTVPYFYVWGIYGNCRKNMWVDRVDSGKNDNWLIICEKW